jgi:hypothetical protein
LSKGGGIVGHLQAAVGGVADEGFPAGQGIANGFGEAALAADPLQRILKEGVQRDEQRHGLFLAYGATLFGGAALEGGFDSEQLGDALQRLCGDGRFGGERNLVDFAPDMRPAGHLGQPRLLGLWIGPVEFLEPGIAVGMQKAAAGAQQGLGMFALAIGRIAVEDGRGRGRPPSALIAHHGP